MPYRFIRTSLVITFLVVVSFLTTSPHIIFSQTTNQGLAVRPAIVDVVIEGEVQEFEITVENISGRAVAVEVEAQPLIVSDGFANLGDKLRYDASQWLSLGQRTLLLEIGEIKTVTVKITPPTDAPPGSHYSQIAFKVLKPEVSSSEQTGADISPQINALIFMTTDGDKIESMQISQSLHGQLSFSGAIGSKVTLTNNGNSHLLARTLLKAQEIGTDKLIVTEANAQVILPGTYRQLELSLNSPRLFARYKVWTEVVSGTPSNTVTTVPIEVIVISPWLLTAIVLLILGLTTYYTLSRNSIKRLHYNNLKKKRARHNHFVHPRSDAEKNLIKKNK